MNEQTNNLPTEEGPNHGECCEDCKRTCKRNFWTSILNTVIKISTIVLAALGLQSVKEE